MNEFDDSLTRIDWLNDLSINFDIVNISNAEFYLSESKDATLKQSKNNIDISSYISKNSLGKPPFSYATLISTAIKNSKSQKLTLSEIYDWISDNFPYFRNTGNGWKNSVRHNLSLNKSFMKISRSRDDPGKGSYWCLTRKHAKNIKNTEDKTKSLSKKTREQFNNVNDRCTEDTCSSHNTSSEINSPESIPFHGSMLNNNTQCSFDFFDEGSLVNEQIMDINHCNQNPDDSRAESFNQLDIKKVFHTIYTSIFPLEKNNSTLPSISSCLKSNENPVYLHNEDRYDTLAQGSNNSDEMRDIFEAASRLKTKSNVKENDLQMWRSCLKQRLYVVQSLDWDRISQSINQNDIKECILKAVNMSKENLTVERLKYLNNLIEKVISIANFVNEPISILTPDEYEESRNFIERLTSNHDYHYTIINPASIEHQQQTTDLALLSSFDSNPSHLLSTGLDMHHHHQRNKSFIWNQIV